jgi:hypothetical protein
MDSSSRKQTWRPFPCVTPTILKAFMVIVSMAANKIVQSSEPSEFLRAQSLNTVVMTLGTMKTAAGMRSTLPMLSSVGRGSHEDDEDMIFVKPGVPIDGEAMVTLIRHLQSDLTPVCCYAQYGRRRTGRASRVIDSMPQNKNKYLHAPDRLPQSIASPS